MAEIHSIPKNPRFKDLRGRRVGAFIILEYAGKAESDGQSLWKCRCELCGAQRVLRHRNMKIQHSCGCLRIVHTVMKFTKHGMCGTKLYAVWQGMIRRCSYSLQPGWKNYGGRGIVVCNGWKRSFATWLLDMGDRPTPKHEIDRIDNDGNYSCGHCDDCIEHGWPANCRWVTRKEQVKNKRVSSRELKLTFMGKTQTTKAWSLEVGLSVGLIGERKLNHWSDADAISTPRYGRRKLH